jgi:hypothetical protein
MFYLLIVLFIVIVSIILRIAAATGLALPLIYGLVAPTLFSEWFHANQQLGEGIGWALLVIVALAWIVSLIRKIIGIVHQHRAVKASRQVFIYRLQQAKAQGMDTINTDGLRR